MNDLFADVEKVGNVYHGYFRIPWRANPIFVCMDNDRKTPFFSEYAAYKAAVTELLFIFRDNTTGWTADGNKNQAQTEWDEITMKPFLEKQMENKKTG